MKRLRIYVDTSVIGDCFDPEFRAWSNGLIEDFRARRFHLVFSDVTAAEIERATVAEVDVLVSWNFQHIVRLDKIQEFNGINLEHGYKPLAIYSPREVTTYERKI
jgi:hypothetical protein